MPGNQRIGVLHGNNHPCDPCINQRVCTGRCSPLVAARFQAQKHVCTTRLFAGLSQSKDLGVRTTGLPVPTATHYGTFIDYYATDIGIWVASVDPASSQTDGVRHVLAIVQLAPAIVIGIVVIRQ